MLGTGMIVRILRLPAVLFFLFLAAGAAAHRAFPRTIGLPSFEVGMTIGGAMFLAGAAVAAAAILTMRRHHTTVEPWESPSALVSSGVFRISRNPIYLALIVLTVAMAVMFDAIWLLVSALLLAITLDVVVIRAEERLVEEALGEEYRQYKRRVRRWM